MKKPAASCSVWSGAIRAPTAASASRHVESDDIVTPTGKGLSDIQFRSVCGVRPAACGLRICPQKKSFLHAGDLSAKPHFLSACTAFPLPHALGPQLAHSHPAYLEGLQLWRAACRFSFCRWILWGVIHEQCTEGFRCTVTTHNRPLPPVCMGQCSINQREYFSSQSMQ